MPTTRRPFLAFMILPIMILPFLCLHGCSPPAQSRELSLAQQVADVRGGSTDIILLESTPLHDAELSSLVDVPGLRVLQLDCIENRLTDAGMKTIANLTQLEHLRIRGGSIGDEGLEAIGDMPNLRMLNLPQGRFTDVGLAHLKTLPKLESLRIGSPHVTDRGIAELKGFPKLLRVHLIDIPLTDRGLADLEAILQLESLYLDGAKISDAAVDELFRKRPNLHVHFNQAHHDRDPNKHEHSAE